jgi:poly-gamma-glutamate synthesis protein (capsule biosynthesis protein)
VTLRFVGDVALGSATSWRLPTHGVALVANIEGPVLDDVSQAVSLVQPYSTRRALEAAFGGSLTVASVANNHAADLGEVGLARTIAHLEALGAVVVGTPLGGRSSHTLLERDGVRIAVLARVADESFGTAVKAMEAAPFVHRLNEVTLLSDVRAALALADRVVVMLHWGQEWLTAPSPARITLARELVEHGADLVIGHHAHVAEAFEVVDGRTIAYGLGTVELRFPDTGAVARTMPRDGKSRAWWARRSLAVDWSPESGETQARTLAWRGDALQVTERARSAHRAYMQAPSVERHRTLSRRDYWASKLRTAWQERILLRPSHVRSLAGIAGEANRAAEGR